MNNASETIVITGGSSGIGAALAELYAAPGRHVAITGRDGDRLEAVAARCRAAGAVVTASAVAVEARQPMADWIVAAEAIAPIACVIANAGISAGTGGGGEPEEQARRIFDVNVTGVLNTVHPALAPMRARRRGRIALMSSLAAFRGFPGAPAYSASKAAVKTYGEALRGELAGDGITVTVICPGYVVSRMTAQNDFPMPLLMEADRAARIVRAGIDRGRARVAFPWPLYAAAWLTGVLPPALTDGILARLPKKQRSDARL